MGAIASQMTSLTIVFSTVYSDPDQRKHQSSASLAFVRGIHRFPVNSPHKWHSRLIPMYNARFILWPPSLSSNMGRERRWPRWIKKALHIGIKRLWQMASNAENVSIRWRHHVAMIQPFRHCLHNGTICYFMSRHTLPHSRRTTAWSSGLNETHLSYASVKQTGIRYM